MSKRVLLAGIAGGLVLFVWGAISHMLLPLGEVGIKEMANEQPVLAAMRENLSESGFYFFPALGGSHATPEQQQAWTEKYRQGPIGILVYQPTGRNPMSPVQLLTELFSNILAVLAAAFLVARAAGLSGFGARVLFVGMMGLLPGLDVDLNYWNWYGFPGTYTLAAAADHVVGWTLAGFAVAAIVKAAPGRALSA